MGFRVKGKLKMEIPVKEVTSSFAKEPVMPTVEGEVCYEGIGEACRQEMQRFMFWATILNGARGFTYGANGVWQINRKEKPFGPSPSGRAWGNVPWDVAYQLPGSHNLGLAKKLLTRYEWWRFESHPEWSKDWSGEEYRKPYAAGIPGKVRIIYCPNMRKLPRIEHLEPGITYRAFLFDPVTGDEYPLGTVTADASGRWRHPIPPIYQDWVIVLEKEG